MDIGQSVLAIFFVCAATGEYDLKESDDLIKMMLRGRLKRAGTSGLVPSTG
jgi:hypothetical protein